MNMRKPKGKKQNGRIIIKSLHQQIKEEEDRS